MSSNPANAAAVFLDRFPNANERTGWSDANLRLLAGEVHRQGATLDDFQEVCTRLLKSPARSRLIVPPYSEVMDALRAYRRSDGDCPALRRVKEIREQYTPPTEEERQQRRNWIASRRTGPH